MLSSNPTITTLNYLIRLNLASELGFETAAEHIKNRGIKLYLKRYAQQRAQFAAELDAEIKKWGGTIRVARNPLAALHRGWIDIKATLTVGRENEAQVVLQECLRGERVALQRYTQARQAVIPIAVDELLQRQSMQIQQVCEQLCRLAQCGDDALLVQFFDHVAAAQQVLTELTDDGIKSTQIQVTAITQIGAYRCNCQRQRLLESSSAGALSGLLAGALAGLVFAMPLLLGGVGITWVMGLLIPILLSAMTGMLGGALLGLLISQGITEDDAYLYETSMQNGSMIVAVQTSTGQVGNTRQILHRQRNQE